MPNNDIHNSHTGFGDIVQGDKHITYNSFLQNEKEKHSFPPLHNAKDFSLAHPTIGRDKDLTAVCDMLAEQQQCIVVNGIGGIGKSILVKYYIQQYKAQYQHIIWLQEKETAVNILLDDGIFLTHLGIYEQVLAFKNASNQTAALELTLSKLNELPKQTLLVADNVSDLNGFEIICNALDKDIFHILATSRKQTGNFAFHELDHLSLPDAKDLFVSYCKQKIKGNPHAQKALLENSTLERILAKIDYHTLTIEIIAKIYNNSKTLSLESLEQKLQEAILNPKLPQTAYTHYTQKETTILATILAAFDIGGLSQQTAALDILAQWAVLPATPIPLEHLIALFGIHTENEDAFDKALTFLTNNAWIQQDKEIENSYACHALIQEAVRWQLKEDENSVVELTKSPRLGKFNYTPLIERLCLFLSVIAYDNPLKKAIWLPYSESILAHITVETEILAKLSNNTAYINQDIGNFFNSLVYGLKAIAICEKILSPEHPHLATSYNNIASIYEAIGDLSKALEYRLKDLIICKKIYPLEHPSLATSYDNIASTYEAIGNLPKSLEYGLKSLIIREKILSPKHPNLANSYNNIAITYKAMGNLSNSLKYGLKALAIHKKVFSPEHPDLATSYNNIAHTYYYVQDYIQSLAYLQKAIQICRKSLPERHPDTKDSIDSMADVLQAAIKAGQGAAVAEYKKWYEEEGKIDV